MILVTGATGFVGRHIVQELFSKGHSVRVLARDVEEAKKLFQKTSVEIWHGDATDADSLKGSMNGVHAVINLVGTLVDTRSTTFEDIHVKATQNLVNEAKAAGVQRFIQMSAANTRSNSESRYHQSKWAAEEIVRHSGLAYTILRPSLIFGKGDRLTSMLAMVMRFPINLLTGFKIPCFGPCEAHLISSANNLHIMQVFQSSFLFIILITFYSKDVLWFSMCLFLLLAP
jgi:uncharacterized protein YbjT (DUF2867 family)